MLQTRALRLVTLLGLSTVAMLLIACEGVVVSTVTPTVETQPTGGAVSPTVPATSTSDVDATAIPLTNRPQTTSIPGTTPNGGGPTAERPTAVSTPGSTRQTPTPDVSLVPTPNVPSPVTVTRPTATKGPAASPTAISPAATSTTVSTAATSTSTVRPTATPTRIPSTATRTPSTGGSSPAGTQAIDVLSDLSRYEGGQLAGLDNLQMARLVRVEEGFDSICNSASDGGSPFGASSIFNDASIYGGPFGANSPFNPDSTRPPGILVDDVLVAHLTLSPWIPDPVDPFAMLEWLGCPVTP